MVEKPMKVIMVVASRGGPIPKPLIVFAEDGLEKVAYDGVLLVSSINDLIHDVPVTVFLPRRTTII